MAWPLSKIYEYMAYYLTKTDEFKEKEADSKLTPEQRTRKLLRFLGGSIK